MKILSIFLSIMVFIIAVIFVLPLNATAEICAIIAAVNILCWGVFGWYLAYDS